MRGRLSFPAHLAGLPVVDLRHLRESRQPVAAYLVGTEHRGESAMLLAHHRGTVHVHPEATR
jgi:hypothetical protein